MCSAPGTLQESMHIPREMERRRQLRDRVQIRSLPHAALQSADSCQTQPQTIGQRFLREAGSAAEEWEEYAKGGFLDTGHGVHPIHCRCYLDLQVHTSGGAVRPEQRVHL